MKCFKLGANEYQCDDKYKFAAIDEKGDVFVYEQEPNLYIDSGYWDYNHHSELEPLKITPIDKIDWKYSLLVL